MRRYETPFSESIFFRDIFPDVSSFQAFVTKLSPPIVGTHPLVPVCYRWLFERFATSSIAYDTPEAFIRHFGLDFTNAFSQLKMRNDMIDAQYSLTPDEIRTTTEQISNMAGNDSSIYGEGYDALAKPLPYVAAQTSAREKDGKLGAYLNAIRNITDLYMFEYLNRFERHFAHIYTPVINYFIEEK